VPALPWAPAELEAAVSAWTTAAAALNPPPISGLPRLPDIVRAEMSAWSTGQVPLDQLPLPRAAALPEPSVPPGPAAPSDEPSPAGATAAFSTPAPPAAATPPTGATAAFPTPATSPPPTGASAAFSASVLSELVALERLLPEAVTGAGMLHGDLRIDNILIDRAGKAWLCDWTWPCLGAPWFDTVSLLVTAVAAYGTSAQADRFLTDAPPEGVDAALAGLAGYWLARAAGPPTSASPHSRQHQLYSGRAALAWLTARRGWS